MNDNTFTFTARSALDPEKVASFTLHNGSISVELGNALLEQAEQLSNSQLEGIPSAFVDWAKPVATALTQRYLEPIPVQDFEADTSNEGFNATWWVRARGKRLLPISMNWNEVDNAPAAEAFVGELEMRKESLGERSMLPNIFDYWATWIVVGLAAVALPVVYLRSLRSRLTRS
jgi:hypothetical protein